MTEERRFSEEEVARIFEQATRVDDQYRRLGSGGTEDGPDRRPPGMTLAEIRRIGQEVGISAEAIEVSARTVATPSSPPEVDRRLLGAPIGVGGSVELPRALTDNEWAQLVTMVRDRFGVRGTVEEAGSLRSWRNGHLRVELEPSDDGQRLRMQTYRKNSADLIAVGGVFVLTALVLGVISLVFGTGGEITPFAVLGLLGGGFAGGSWLSLRPWSEQRRDQMVEISQRAVELASRPLPGAEVDPESPV